MLDPSAKNPSSSARESSAPSGRQLKRRSPIHDLRRAYRDYDSVNAFLKDINAETDRVVVILGAAKLDLLLYQILQSFFRPSPSPVDELLDGDAPLGTFSSKINAAFRLGLIDAEFARALHILRKVRNAFAHETSGCNLSEGAHRERIRELIKPFKQFRKFRFFRATFVGKDADGIAADFRTALALMVVRLEGCLEHTATLVTKREMNLVFADWDAKKANAKQVDEEKDAARN